jgi:microcystin-dependent protein
MVGFNFPPRGWAQCDGQILPINQNQSLYSLLGTTYGGDGRTSFALPDLRGRAPVHVGSDLSLGDKTGEETHILSSAEMPSHTHAVNANDADGNSPLPMDTVLGGYDGGYGPAADLAQLESSTVSSVGGGQSHNNMQPFLTVNFVIAIQGLFPSRN